MKVILLLVAIYSLIFYQHYKIENSKISPPLSEPKAGKSYQDDPLTNQQDYGGLNFLIRSHYSIAPERQIANLGFYE